MITQIKPTDEKYYTSPDAGEDCICSRCLQPILIQPVRIFPQHEVSEYRYHFKCIGQSATLEDPDQNK